MNNYFQIAIGIIPALIFVILYYALKKKKKTKCIITIICFGIVFAFCLFKGTSSIIHNKNQQLTAQNRLSLAYSLAMNNKDLSDTALKEYVQNDNYTDDITLFNARQNALDGEYKAAKVLYEKVLKNDSNIKVDDEYELVLKAYNSIYAISEEQTEESQENSENTDSNSNDNSDNSDNEDNTDNNNNDEENDNNESDESNDQNNIQSDIELEKIAKQIKQKINKNVLKDEDDEVYETASKYITNAEQIYSQYLQTNDRDSKDISKTLKKIKNLEEENPELSQSNTFRLAKLKMLIMKEDYEQIAENVDDYSSYDELLIVSELYINGYIKNSDFSDDLTGKNNETYDNVINHLENVYDEIYGDEPKVKRTEAKNYIKSLKLELKNTGLTNVSNNLENKLNNCDSNNTTKVYLELSKIQNYFNNSEKANQYIEKSMGSVSTCMDDNFTQPMYQVIGIMATNDDPEKLKDVATYVDKIVTNTTTIRMADELTQSKNTYDENSDNDNKEDNDKEQQIQFKNYMSDYVSKKCAAINIINIDKSNFPNIEAKIAFDSDIAIDADSIKKQLTVADCDDEITNYKLEKVNYSKANILLCCDLSGSMAGDIDNLKNAVNLFIQNKMNNEKIGLLTFDDDIINTYKLGTSNDTLLKAVDSFNAFDGTDIFTAATTSIDMFSNDDNALNIIIVMSDGQDNDKKSQDLIINNIGNACKNKNIQLYSLGLGSGVDAEYLNCMSASTGGSYLYVNDSSSLKSFYEYINNQFLNQYIISYEAKDKTTNDRTLFVNMTEDDTHDIAHYSLIDEKINENSDDVSDDLDNENDNISITGKHIQGLDTRLIYKSDSDNIVHLIGTDFKKNDKITAKIQGALSYDLPYKFVDENTIELTIPKSVCVGTYDLYVTVGSENAILDKELTVAVMGSEKTTEFGPYKFTSFVKVVDGNTITLSGNVSLNGWLTFNDTVTLEGDMTSSSIRMTDNSGSRINYYQKTSKGFAKLLAKGNIPLVIPSMRNVDLYNDTAHSLENGLYQEDYTTTKILVPLIHINNLMDMEAPSLRLYPDRFVLDIDGFTTKLPMQNQLLKSNASLFNYKPSDVNVVFTNKEIGCDMEITNKDNVKNAAPVLSNLGNMPIDIYPVGYDIKIDTIKNKYFIKLGTKLKFGNLDEIALSMEWRDNSNMYEQKSLKNILTPYEVRLYADYNINTVICDVPVTFHKFELALTEIKADKPISKWCLEGKMSVAAAKVDEYLPGISKYIGDVSAFSFDNATAKLRLNGTYIKVSTDFNILGKIKLAQAELEMGKFKYTNSYINMYKEDVAGIRASLKTGVMWDSDNCKIDISGTNELTVTDKLIGISSHGQFSLDVHWWVLAKAVEQQGDVIIGFHKDHSGEMYFIVFANYYDKDKKSQTIELIWRKGSDIEFSTSNV